MTQPPADDLVERLLTIAGYSDISLAFSNRRALREAAAELTRLRAMCDELAGVVEPFGKHPDFHAPDDWPVTRLDTNGEDKPGVTAGDFRRARTAYAKYQQEQGR